MPRINTAAQLQLRMVQFLTELNESRQDEMSDTTKKRLAIKYKHLLKDIEQYQQAQEEHEAHTFLTRQYHVYRKSGYKKHNKGIKGWRLNELTKPFRSHLKSRIQYSINLITTQTNARMAKLENRFLNWVQGPRTESIKTELAQHEEWAKAKKHNRMILRDQTSKMIGNFDHIVAEKYKAIGFYWRTRRDKKVVGNPSGLYPGSGNEKHQDHYHRNGKFYFYKDAWVFNIKGLIDRKSDIEYAESLTDGLPGQPINCRCYAENVYEIADIPKKYIIVKDKSEENQ